MATCSIMECPYIGAISGGSKIFQRGVPVFHRKVRPHGFGLLHLLLAGHRGWVWEGDVPPPCQRRKLLVFLA